MFGGIDLGGSKIEACLFDADLFPVHTRRIATPVTSYSDLVDALIEQYDWLRTRASSDLGHRFAGHARNGLADVAKNVDCSTAVRTANRNSRGPRAAIGRVGGGCSRGLRGTGHSGVAACVDCQFSAAARRDGDTVSRRRCG